MREIDLYYFQIEEPTKGTLDALRKIILSQDKNITESWKYKMPFFCYKNKMFCYLWVHKKSQQPYIGIVEGGLINHSDLIQENRSRMKIMLFNPNEDLPIQSIENLLKEVIELYSSGKIKTK